VTGVGRDISTLVVRVDGQVQPHQLYKLLVIAIAQKSCQVGGVILVLVNLGHFPTTIDIPEDPSGNVGELGNEIHGVIESRLPVFSLVDTVRVGFGKGGIMVESGNGQGELRHRVQSVGTSVNQLFDEFGDSSPSGPFLGETLDLLLGGYFSSKEQPEEGLGKGLGSTGGGRELFLAFRDGLASESDTFVGVKDGSFPDKALDPSHTTVSLINGHLPKALVSMCSSDSLDILNLLGDELGHTILEGLDIGGWGRGEGARELRAELSSESISSDGQAHY